MAGLEGISPGTFAPYPAAPRRLAHRRSPWRVSLLRYARLPRPASKAAPPIPNSRPSCSPAVPPPPVDGGPAGTAGAVVACAVAVVVCGDAVVACAVAVVVCGDAVVACAV